MADKVGMIGVFISRRLRHIHIFLNRPLKKSIVDIELMQWPIHLYINCKNHSNCGWFNHWTEGFVKINYRPLSEPFCTKRALYLSMERSTLVVFETTTNKGQYFRHGLVEPSPKFGSVLTHQIHPSLRLSNMEILVLISGLQG